jgi:hypothetical protein
VCSLYCMRLWSNLVRESRLITDNGGVLRAKQLLAICAEVLGQKTSKLRTPEQLQRIFSATRFLRRLDRMGYAQFRRWKLYGEEALARHSTVIWLHGDALTVEYQEIPLARGHCSLLTRYKALQSGGRRPDDAKRRKKPMPLQLPLLEDPPVAQE